MVRPFCCLVFVLCLQITVSGSLNYEGSGAGSVGTAARVVKEEERTPVVATEFGSISGVDIGRNEYRIQFITMEPNALFLPVLLHADLVFYVHTGSGRLSWTEGDDINKVSLQRGDVYRLKSGTLFYLHSNVEPERSRFRIIAMFSNTDEQQLLGPSAGPYSSVTDLVRGFDKPVLQAAFQVPEEVIDELTSTTETPAIVEGNQKSKKKFWEEEVIFINALFGIQRLRNQRADNKKKHTKTFNFYKEDPDFQNCHGWSKVVTKHDLLALHGSQIGVFMVSLTKGSIMGPHWNPTATEVSIVIEGEGMVQVVCPSALTNKECKNSRIRVEEGDVFTVPRFHPMAQTSFNNGSLVFMGFSTASKKNHPQFLAGKASVLQTLDKFILGVSFNVSNTTVGQLLAAQKESIILDCTSCAEEQEIVMEEEIETERREEEERKREEEEEARRREEEEKKRHEEEERRRREEEERKRREEEEAARRREEEEKRRQEEEERRKREEEERKRREEEERKREEEEAARRREEEEKRRQEEEEWKRREEEERKRREEEERKREEEEAARRRQEEEEERKREEEAKRRKEEERKREEEEAKKREQEEEERRQQEEEKQRQQEQEEERRREEESRRRQEEEQKRREQEEEQRRQQQEEEEQRRQQEEQRQQEEEQQRQQEEEKEEKQRQQQEEQRRREEERKEEQRRQEEEQQRQQQEEREEKQRRQEEEKRQQEEQQRRQEEWQERQRQEKEQRKREEQRRRKEEIERQEEEQRGREEERGRGEGESEEEMARREEEERIERQREQEEGGWRWGDLKFKIN